MRTHRCSWPDGFWSTTRCPSWAPMRRASRRRHREEARGPWLLHAPDPVANVRGLLELLALDRAAQPLTQLGEHSRSLDQLALRRLIVPSDVARMAMHPTKQLPDARLEL